MKLSYLGDCMDLYKKWFIESVGVKQVFALPMFSDEWEQSDVEAYERLLGVKVANSAMMPNKPVSDSGRKDYFAGAQGECIFLDPDTGLRLGKKPQRKRHDEYLFIEDLKSVLPEGSDRIALVYDQSIARGSEVEFASRKIEELGRMGFAAVGYCAQAATLAISRAPEALRPVLEGLQGLDLPPERIQSNLRAD